MAMPRYRFTHEFKLNALHLVVVFGRPVQNVEPHAVVRMGFGEIRQC